MASIPMASTSLFLFQGPTQGGPAGHQEALPQHLLDPTRPQTSSVRVSSDAKERSRTGLGTEWTLVAACMTL